jgi:glycerol-3-phosphate dehydrogenase
LNALSEICDVLVVGGGINGAGIARDAAGRGLRTVLCEQHDLASHTSSASTKLIHGGLRYLEYYDFVLVRKSLQEREVVLASAPHLAWPLRFVLPHDSHLRPAWMIRAGLFMYDHLATRRRLPASATIDLRTHPAGQALDPRYRTGFEYSDGWVDDARLVVANAVDALERGAEVLTRTACVGLQPDGAQWIATLRATDGRERTLRARLVVNAAGPWVAEFLDRCTPTPARHHPRLIRGSHIVVRKLFDHDFAYIFQAPDGRIVFALPYEGDFTLVGTTESEYTGDLAHPAIAAAEQQYLLDMANRYFRRDLGVNDVVWTFAGLRPLLAASADDPKSVTRDYVIDFDLSGPPLLSVYGGKLTTYRKLAETVLSAIAPALGNASGAWTAAAPLPGGDMPDADFERFLAQMRASHDWLAPALLHRYARAYGTRIHRLLEGCTRVDDLGTAVLPGLYQREIDYLRRHEFARTAEDILYRRSKLGVHLGAGSVRVLQEWLETSG